MNINKLNIKPQDIDTDTGRIILPSMDGLERMKESSKPSSKVDSPVANDLPPRDEGVRPLAALPQDQRVQPLSVGGLVGHEASDALLAAESSSKVEKAGWVLTPSMLALLLLISHYSIRVFIRVRA